MAFQGDVLHHHGGADLRRHRRAHASSGPTCCSSRCGRSSSMPRSRTGCGAAASWPTWAPGTSPAAPWCTSTRASAALVAAMRPRQAHGLPRSSSLLPHNVPLVLLGAGLLWFGWFGFNAGSALAASPIAGLAFVTTMLAPAATLVVWTILDLVRPGKPTAVGCGHGHRGGPRGHHAGGGLHQPDERPAPRRHRRGAELLRPHRPRQDRRSTTRSTWWPRTAWAARSAPC